MSFNSSDECQISLQNAPRDYQSVNAKLSGHVFLSYQCHMVEQRAYERHVYFDSKGSNAWPGIKVHTEHYLTLHK